MSQEPDAIIERLTARLDQVERELASLRSRALRDDDGFDRIFLAKATDGTQWQEQCLDAGEIVDFDDGRVSDEDGHASNLIEPGEAFVLMELEDVDDDGNQIHRYVKVGGGFFPVNLEQTGGGNGTMATPATWTYDVTTEGGTELDTGVAPVKTRPNGTRVAATRGVCYYDIDGTLILWDHDEREGTGTCS